MQILVEFLHTERNHRRCLSLKTQGGEGGVRPSARVASGLIRARFCKTVSGSGLRRVMMRVKKRKGSGRAGWRKKARGLHCLPALTIIFAISAEQEPFHFEDPPCLHRSAQPPFSSGK